MLCPCYAEMERGEQAPGSPSITQQHHSVGFGETPITEAPAGTADPPPEATCTKNSASSTVTTASGWQTSVSAEPAEETSAVDAAGAPPYLRCAVLPHVAAAYRRPYTLTVNLRKHHICWTDMYRIASLNQ